MPSVEKWLAQSAAAARLRDHLDLSQGAAEAKLFEIWRSGHIRAADVRLVFNGIGNPGIVKAEIIRASSPTSIMPADAEVSGDDLEFWLKEHTPKPKASAGRKASYDRDKIRARAFELMDHHGDFDIGDSDWNAQARLEEKITGEFGMSTTTCRDLLPDILESWRKRKVGY